MKVCITKDGFLKHCNKFDGCKGNCEEAEKVITISQLLTVEERTKIILNSDIGKEYSQDSQEVKLLTYLLNQAQQKKAGLK